MPLSPMGCVVAIAKGHREVLTSQAFELIVGHVSPPSLIVVSESLQRIIEHELHHAQRPLGLGVTFVLTAQNSRSHFGQLNVAR